MAFISEQLADFTAGLGLAQVPGAVALRAKHLILDAIGCGFAARKEDFAVRIAASVAKLAGEGPRRTLGMAHRLPLRDAAVVNGGNADTVPAPRQFAMQLGGERFVHMSDGEERTPRELNHRK